MDRDDDDDTGYGKPPKQTRFRKGQSCNSKRRSKGTRDFNNDLADVLKAKSENRGRWTLQIGIQLGGRPLALEG